MTEGPSSAPSPPDELDDDAIDVEDHQALERLAAARLELRDRESVVPVELFFDLVFVLAFTQCTVLMARDPSWSGLGRGVLALAVLWWAWVLYTWFASVVEPEEGAARLVMIVATVAMLVVALNLPEAYGDHALGFALAYGAVRLLHSVLYLVANRAGSGMRREVLRVAASTVVVVALLVAAAWVDGPGRVALWCGVVALDWGTALFGDERWGIVPRHFAERHNLMIIIALGESIVSLGVAADVELTGAVVVSAALGATIAAALWWMYFDVVSLVTERRLEAADEGRPRMALARDSYAYLHFPMVAGIILAALGLEDGLHHVDRSLSAVHATALFGGVALYLLAHVALRLRNARTVNWERLVAAVLLLALIPVSVHLPALAATAVVAAVAWGVIAYEALFVYDERRYRLRHGMDVDAV